MASTVTINRAGIFCADPNCGKELKVGSKAKIYHSKTKGRQYYGLDGCHEKKKLTSEEFMALKRKKQEYLIQKDDKELDDLMILVQVSTREEVMEMLRKDDDGSIDADEKEVLAEIQRRISKHQNPRLGAYAWPRLRSMALNPNQLDHPSVEKPMSWGEAMHRAHEESAPRPEEINLEDARVHQEEMEEAGDLEDRLDAALQVADAEEEARRNGKGD